MKITFESNSNFEETTKWLVQSAKKIPSNTINMVGRDGVAALSARTPVGETGETARGWNVKIENKNNVTELSFVNSAHPESRVNVARLIDSGHGTGTGGYVAPIPYIRQAIDPIFQKVSEQYMKEMID